VSALAHLNLDEVNRTYTTDARLIRRMVRDSFYRAYLAEETLRQWPSVRRGEDKYIFPYQQEADAFFNSALPYELLVLKPLLTRCFLKFQKRSRNTLMRGDLKHC